MASADAKGGATNNNDNNGLQQQQRLPPARQRTSWSVVRRHGELTYHPPQFLAFLQQFRLAAGGSQRVDVDVIGDIERPRVYP
jgi:hypothetical protein